MRGVERWLLPVALLGMIASAALWGALMYVVWHFVAKYW